MAVTPIPRRPEDVLADLRALASPGDWRTVYRAQERRFDTVFAPAKLNAGERRAVEDAIALIESLLIQARCECEQHRADERDPREGGWFCDSCGIYFCTGRERCPDCGAHVDRHLGWAVRS